MWFFLIKSIVGAILGQATNAWFKKTAMGKWFYGKMESWYNWAAERYDLKILTAEEKIKALENKIYIELLDKLQKSLIGLQKQILNL